MNTNTGGVSAISDGLGGLPDAVWAGPNGGSLYYTAGQMRAYAAEQVAAERERWLSAVTATVHSEQDLPTDWTPDNAWEQAAMRVRELALRPNAKLTGEAGKEDL